MTAQTGNDGTPCRFLPAGVLWPFFLSRLWVALWVYIGHSGRPFRAPVSGGWEGVANWWLNPWTTYDSLWFTRIAHHGYESVTTPFFPLYPALLQLAGTNAVATALWGVVLSNAALLGALLLLHRLTTIDHDLATARLTVWLVAFFPTSAYFSAVYTESFFLLLLTATFLCVRRGHWGQATVWALLAALTRNSGLLMCVALALEYSGARRRGDVTIATAAHRRAAILAICAPLLGFLAVQLFFVWRFGGVLAGVQSQELYGRTVTLPWTPLLRDLGDALTGQAFNLSDYLHVLTVLAVFGLLIVWWKKMPLSYSVLVLGITLMNLTYSWIMKPHTGSIVRFMMTTFPFSQMTALQTRKLAPGPMLKVTLVVSYLAVCAVMSWLFGMKSFTG